MGAQSTFFNEILVRQIKPSFRMIARIIEVCPRSIWAQRNINPPIWQQVYHVLYGMDYWFSESKEAFSPPAFNEDVNSVLGEESKGFVDQEDMKGYLKYVSTKADGFIENLDQLSLLGPSPLYDKWTNLDVILEQARHLQHHLGYLNRILYKCNIEPVEWEFYEV